MKKAIIAGIVKLLIRAVDVLDVVSNGTRNKERSRNPYFWRF